MARLMIVPIEDRGDAVLIFTRYAETELVGFILLRTLAAFFQRAARDCDYIDFVRRNLPRLEPVLLRKRRESESTEGSIPCVELASGDLPALKPPNHKMPSSRAGESPSETCRWSKTAPSILKH